MFRALALLVLLWMPLACTQSVAKNSLLEVASNSEIEVASVSLGPEEEFEEILACVKSHYPAHRYMTNEFLPDPDAPWVPLECETVDKILVGMPWVLNDEEAPWYNAIEKGFYADMCLEVELMPGGPSIQPLTMLAGGGTDFAVPPGGAEIPAFELGPTPGDTVAIGTFLRGSPYIWLGLDPDTPQDQVSNKVLTPEDFIGTTVGVQSNSNAAQIFMKGKYGLTEGVDITYVPGGFTPDPVLMGAMDYIGAWIVNQPRLLEAQGYMNWVAFRFADWGYDTYTDTLAARRATLENNPDLVRRYLAATYQGTKFLLEHPEESAEIAVKWGVDAQVTKEQALRRFELQESMVRGPEGSRLLEMDPDFWNRSTARMIQFGELETEECGGAK